MGQHRGLIKQFCENCTHYEDEYCKDLAIKAYPKAWCFGYKIRPQWALHVKARVVTEQGTLNEQLAKLKEACPNILGCLAENIEWKLDHDRPNVWVGSANDQTVEIIQY